MTEIDVGCCTRYRCEEQVKKNVEKRGIKCMEMMEEETWND